MAQPLFATITWADLTAVVHSSIIDTDQQDRILAEMASTVEGDLIACGINPDAYVTLPLAIRTLLLLYGRLLIFTYDGSAGLLASEIREGSEAIKFAGRGDKAGDSLLRQYITRLQAFCRQNSPGRQPMAGTIVGEPQANKDADLMSTHQPPRWCC